MIGLLSDLQSIQTIMLYINLACVRSGIRENTQTSQAAAV